MELDGHAPLFPTHEVCSPSDGSTVGYLSLLNTPVLNFWMHTKNAKARDSWFALQVAENIAAQHTKALVLPCTTTSPYYTYLPRLGYKSLGQFELFVKDLA